MTTLSPLAAAANRFRSAYAAMLFSPAFAELKGRTTHDLALAIWRREARQDATLIDLLAAADAVEKAARLHGVDLDHAIVALDAAQIELQSLITLQTKRGANVPTLLYATRRGG